VTHGAQKTRNQKRRKKKDLKAAEGKTPSMVEEGGLGRDCEREPKKAEAILKEKDAKGVRETAGQEKEHIRTDQIVRAPRGPYREERKKRPGMGADIELCQEDTKAKVECLPSQARSGTRAAN